MSPVFSLSLSLSLFVRLLPTTRNRRLSRTIEEKEELVYLVDVLGDTLSGRIYDAIWRRERERERMDKYDRYEKFSRLYIYIHMRIDRNAMLGMKE